MLQLSYSRSTFEYICCSDSAACKWFAARHFVVDSIHVVHYNYLITQAKLQRSEDLFISTLFTTMWCVRISETVWGEYLRQVWNSTYYGHNQQPSPEGNYDPFRTNALTGAQQNEQEFITEAILGNVWHTIDLRYWLSVHLKCIATIYSRTHCRRFV